MNKYDDKIMTAIAVLWLIIGVLGIFKYPEYVFVGLSIMFGLSDVSNAINKK